MHCVQRLRSWLKLVGVDSTVTAKRLRQCKTGRMLWLAALRHKNLSLGRHVGSL
jgi:hypothetical protein